MTSSLVGSEMCIRDRCSHILETGRSMHITKLEIQPHIRKRPKHAQKPVPVSYTHLTLPTICSV
eukprot:6318347-Prorocentrum_lima.AAC.1